MKRSLAVYTMYQSCLKLHTNTFKQTPMLSVLLHISLNVNETMFFQYKMAMRLIGIARIFD